MRELISEINQNIKNNKQLDTDINIIKDLPWISNCAIKPYLKLLESNAEKSRKLLFSMSEMYNDWQKQDSDILIAEATFESF